MITRWGAPIGALLLILLGLALSAGPFALWGTGVWYAGLILIGGPVVWRTLVGLVRGQFAADVVAMLAILTALAVGQPLPGLVVVLMQTGGEALERYAAGRASRAVEELEAAAPRRATRILDHTTEEIAAELVHPGDLLLVRPGDMVPCDSEVVEGTSHVDASRLTGEPVPIHAQPGVRLLSGSLNGEGPLRVCALSAAGESQYAKIVQLVRSAAASKSPLQRMADRYAVWFTPLTLLVCAVAWITSGEVMRVLSVLVVATPCPLILAAPVAMIGGLNRAARRGIIIRHGEALERLGDASSALLDKTGTLTIGRPDVGRVLAEPPHTEREVLTLAAALDSGSNHVLARPIVSEAKARGLPLPAPSESREQPGLGIQGRVNGREVAIGAPRYLRAAYPSLPRDWPSPDAPGLRAWVTIDGAPGGAIEFSDRVRPEARELVRGLRRLGLRRIVMVTGDTPQHAAAIGRDLELTEVRAGLLAADKVRAVEELENQGEKVIMVGDGTNDAPALSRASVGVAMASHGGGITAEAADAVILADNPALVVDAISLSRRTISIARQSVWAGLGLSGVAMIVAATGQIPPIVGAFLQEAIDVAVILNALRASGEEWK